eukprot:CAMPEP_0176016426 /NCGR_PEP_ID=MMETSP0120_2-20121206/7842_1 /TAXON_ID=160619 /ORGANISM="Kryptoperidinium foliaceum, Strain CCMP 1326" /LENGTH=166 /DNA_ID=CAMNT_0017349417 /DNA_START=69 /DNA_END=565 /DNA_ORIENTATION=-
MQGSQQQYGSSGSSAISELKQWLSTPPANLPPQQQANPHAVAHAQLQALRDAGDSQYLFLRCILESSTSTTNPQDEELLFHCITGCRQVLLMKWKTLASVWKRGVRDYLWGLGMHSHASSRTIRMAYFNASASCWKRGWVEDMNAHLQGKAPPDATTTAPSQMEQA